MDGKPASPEEPAQGGAPDGQDEAHAADAPAAGAPERFGPLVATRLHKDDGRSLIVFERAEGAE